MKRFKFVCLLIFSSFLFGDFSYSEGLPANPWQNPQRINAMLEKESSDVVEQASTTAADIWSKVRDTKEFRKWSMPQTNDAENNNFQDLKNKADMLMMLSNLNRVGYALPNNYQNTIKKMPKKSDVDLGISSYEDSLKQWKRKYGNMKNNSLNILDNSYRRVLSTIKNSTGVDINRAINDSLNAFK